MLLFDKALHEGIKDGRVTVAFRNWNGPRVNSGKRYHVSGLGDIFIEDVSRVTLADVTEDDARAAGAESLADWQRRYTDRNPKANFERDSTYRIRLQYLGDDAERVRVGQLGEEDLRRLDRSLAHIDVQSYEGEWTRFFIAALTKKRWMRPGELAQALDTDQDMVRRKMRVLVELGIVRADPGLGYSLSDGGRKLYAYRMRG
ncbi:MAG: hypothetical protein JSV65_09090 [Armatimonadota bacterium]|nr:MAG: hypothetical protein JSV65_09090 [Armatimonadota bacterium]